MLGRVDHQLINCLQTFRTSADFSDWCQVDWQNGVRVAALHSFYGWESIKK